MSNQGVTVEQVVAWGPCGLRGEDNDQNYTRARIERLFAGREVLTARDIANLEISHEDALWALFHNEFLTDVEMHGLACDFAERVVDLCGDDPRPRAAIEAKRGWLRGEVSDEELAAARDAAWAARDAAWAAARAARAAARDARDAETAWQMGQILEMIGK